MVMNINKYTPDQIVDILYNGRFQNYQVNRLLKAYESLGTSRIQFDGTVIRCTTLMGKTVTVDLDRIANSKKSRTLSRRMHDWKGKFFNQDYRRRLEQLVYLSGVFGSAADGLLVKPLAGLRFLSGIRMQTTLADRCPTDQICFLTNNPKWVYQSSVLILDLPKNVNDVPYLSKAFKAVGLSYTELRQEILMLTREIACNNYKDQQKDQISRLKGNIQKLKQVKLHLVTFPGFPNSREMYQLLEIIDEFLEFLKKIGSELETEKQTLLDPINRTLNKPYSPGVSRSSPIKLKLTNKKTIELDREDLKYYLLAFEGADIELKAGKGIDFSEHRFKDDELYLLDLYFTDKLTEENLYTLSEASLLSLFDISIQRGMPRLEALLGREIIQRVFKDPYKDAAGVVHTRAWSDKKLLEDREHLDMIKSILTTVDKLNEKRCRQA